MAQLPRAAFAWTGTRTTRDTFTLQGDLYDEEAGESVQATSYTPPYSQIIDANALLSGGNILGRWKRIVSDGNDIQVQAYYDRTNRQAAELRRDSQYLRRRFSAASSIAGAAGGFVGPGRACQPVTTRWWSRACSLFPIKRTDYLVTAFLQDEIGAGGAAPVADLGTKLLQTNFTSGVDLEPSARLLWTPDDKQTVWAAFTHALRTPSDAEENFYLLGYIGDDCRTGRLISRASMPIPTSRRNSSMATNSATAGCWARNFYVDFTGFYNHYHDLFSEDLAGPAFPRSRLRRRRISCFRRSSATDCSAIPREWKSLRNGDRRLSGGCEDPIRICI